MRQPRDQLINAEIAGKYGREFSIREDERNLEYAFRAKLANCRVRFSARHKEGKFGVKS